MESVIIKKKASQQRNGFTGEVYWIFKEELHQSFSFSQEQKMRKHFLTYSIRLLVLWYQYETETL